MVLASELRKKYLRFFESKNHKVIPSAPLVPENDPTVLFTTAGMHPLVPYLLGQPHPLGKRLVDYQKCVRTDDIDEVGDTFHHTFFEMLGNWSLGDYFKKEAISWSYEFLKDELKIDMDRLFITCFEGDSDAPKDEESARIWESLGVPNERIYFYGKKDNWWGPAGQTGPCGPDTEMHYDATQKPCSKGENCTPGCECGRFCEIWNDVFMQYNKTPEGKFEKLAKPSVDTGMGLERTTTILNHSDDNYLTDLWQPAIKKLSEITQKQYEENQKSFRIIADHIRAAVFIINDGVRPSNKERGYILRRLIRRALYQIESLGVKPDATANQIAEVFIRQMSEWYPELTNNEKIIISTLEEEVQKSADSLKRGIPETRKLFSAQTPKTRDDAMKIIESNMKPYSISAVQYLAKFKVQFGSMTSLPSIAAGTTAFIGSSSYGVPPDISWPMIESKIPNPSLNDFRGSVSLATQYHQDHSRTTSGGMFKGGLQDQSDAVVKYHTATHLLHTALRHVLGFHVQQKGSNITSERLRFDFSHTAKLTPDELSKVEAEINAKISENIPVTRVEMPKAQALSEGALAFFPEKYPDITSVYTIGDYSKELCGGPHVKSTGEIGKITLTREESAGAGIRRIYAQIAET